jgi:hypothetical protein
MRRPPRCPLAIVALILLCSACDPGVRGTYADRSGTFVLDLKSGGEATFAIPGAAVPCTYKVAGDRLTLDCPGGAGTLVLAVHPDGSLTAPQDRFMPTLQRRKS